MTHKPAYYNEINPFAAQWLRNLIAAGHIAPGEVDTRSIEDVRADDLRGFTQCHFFAGIGVWSYALRRAGVPDSRNVWTASCPCQPFSEAGSGAGFNDERHLWPACHQLIALSRPAEVFGEQVASKDAEPWIDLVHTDMETLGYAFGAVPFPAAGVGAPEIRDRIYWVGYADAQGLERHAGGGDDSPRREGSFGPVAPPGHVNGFWADAEWRDCTDGYKRPIQPGVSPMAYVAPNFMGRVRAYGNAIVAEAACEFVSAYLECRP